jgi:hypothetical protein
MYSGDTIQEIRIPFLQQEKLNKIQHQIDQ